MAAEESRLWMDEQYGDLELGLADASVLVLAKRFRATRLLTFDERDFRAITPLGAWAAPRQCQTARGRRGHRRRGPAVQGPPR
jgi:hypothetical protein